MREKSPYPSDRVGNGQPVTFSGKTDFSDRKYDVDLEFTSLKAHKQGNDWTCSNVEKLIDDDFFCVSGQESINSEWLDYANNSTKGYLGLKSEEIFNRYESAGYSVNPYRDVMNSENALPWIAGEMRQGRVVHIIYGNPGHTVSIPRLRYMFDFKNNIINLNGAGIMHGISRITVKNIFSVWHQ